jgi:hypothetical protein
VKVGLGERVGVEPRIAHAAEATITEHPTSAVSPMPRRRPRACPRPNEVSLEAWRFRSTGPITAPLRPLVSPNSRRADGDDAAAMHCGTTSQGRLLRLRGQRRRTRSQEICRPGPPAIVLFACRATDVGLPSRPGGLSEPAGTAGTAVRKRRRLDGCPSYLVGSIRLSSAPVRPA